MNDIQSLTIDEFNKQMRQPTLHPQVAVIESGTTTKMILRLLFYR